MWYPKCRAGFHPVGCNICRPERPDCKALGLNNGIDLSCAKKIKIGTPVFGKCGSNQDRDGGLCYSKCPSGYRGVGPVCWGMPPSRWAHCGMGAAKSDSVCKRVIANQVVSVGQFAMFIGSMGTSAGGAGPPDSGSKFQELMKKFEELKKKYKALKDKYPQINQIQEKFKVYKESDNIYKTVNRAIDGGAPTAADLVRISASIAALVDKSGVSAIVAGYSYSRCSKYFR